MLARRLVLRAPNGNAGVSLTDTGCNPGIESAQAICACHPRFSSTGGSRTESWISTAVPGEHDRKSCTHRPSAEPARADPAEAVKRMLVENSVRFAGRRRSPKSRKVGWTVPRRRRRMLLGNAEGGSSGRVGAPAMSMSGEEARTAEIGITIGFELQWLRRATRMYRPGRSAPAPLANENAFSVRASHGPTERANTPRDGADPPAPSGSGADVGSAIGQARTSPNGAHVEVADLPRTPEDCAEEVSTNVDEMNRRTRRSTGP